MHHKAPFCLALCLLVSGITMAGGLVLINEVDYCQPSIDEAEFIELANRTNKMLWLDDYSVELVNGATLTVYQTIDLPHVSIPAGGYFVICGDAANVPNCDLDILPNSNLIQNGDSAPDAVALRRSGELVDTLSYEGDAFAPYTEGSGVGLADTPTQAGASLSRCPDRNDTDVNNEDFRLRPITPGAANECAAELVINEIDYDQASGDTAEFLEIKNVSDAAIDLDPYRVSLLNGATGVPYDSIDLPSVSLAAGDYYVICANATTVANCDLDVTPDTNLIQNGAPDGLAIWLGEIVVDALSYEGDSAVPYIEGSGVGLEDDSSLTDVGLSRCQDGWDSNNNKEDFAPQAITPGLTNSCPPAAASVMLINEVDVDQAGNDGAEFVELYDGGTGNMALDGLVLVFYNGASDTSYAAYDLDGQSTDANGFFVMCGNAANVLNCDMDVTPDDDLIMQGADAIGLYIGDAGDFPNGTAVTTANLVDALVYDTDDSDDVGLLVLLNFAQPQVNEDGGGSGVSAVNSMQRCSNGSGGQRNTSSYTLNTPTPGVGNGCGNCVDMDGDGYGQPGDADCVAGPAADCDDTDKNVNPGRVEICDNNVDDDCDGLLNKDDHGDCVLLYVELESFTAEWDGSRVVVRWKTVVEKDNAGFRVLRHLPRVRKAAEAIHAGHIYPMGSESYGAEYEVVDNEKLAAGTVHYYLEDIDMAGEVTRHGPVEVQIPGRSRQAPLGRQR